MSEYQYHEFEEDRIDDWGELLPEAERSAWLIRLAKGEPRLDMHLLRRLREVATHRRRGAIA